MEWRAQLLVLVCLTVSCLAQRKRYDGYQQWIVTPTNREQVDLLRSLEGEQVMFFNGLPRHANKKVEMLVSPSVAKRYYTALLKTMPVEVANTNIQTYLDAEFARLDAKHKPGYQVYDPDDYNTLADINSELSVLAAGACPGSHTCEVTNMGASYEGREILQLSITSSSSHNSVWLDSLIHAREWLAGATLMRLTDYLLKSYGSDADATHLLDNYDWYVTPVMNPDGYEYSWTNDRFWRKSRNANDGSSCEGTDLNRNYPTYWDAGSGSSNNPCSDEYHGSFPGSEPETQVAMNAGLGIQDENGRMISWVTIHTAAEYYLLPYGGTSNFDCNYPAVYDQMLQAADAAISAMEDVGGLNWVAANACAGFYPADGITMDWTHDPIDGANAKYSYTPELRGPGFDPPASAIEPSFQENWAGLVAMIREIDNIEGF